ncbi:endonuclease [Phaeobacter sp. 22II1-1F12B]|uniref:endonuclease/exonuclease/phosphatase family protein n=1 Tax=Phaeobacter sp. 22II1-1F12B TaxID=1317111 RepID=UPI000B529115|nr:endonuclease [Phaeobacter sp. 22II1-1F12B]OWU79433.1 endonuclease [Phaeobacter sp. 22II1-1F12B]
MRLATYNVEWFANLFDNDNALMVDNGPSGRFEVRRGDQIDALGAVFTALDADGILIVEAPNTGRKQNSVAALENFARYFSLRQSAAVSGFSNDTQQEISLLYDPSLLKARHDPQSSPAAPQFDASFHIDLDIDAHADTIRFSKPPLELAAETASGVAFRLIGAHLKSKAPHGARNDAAIMRLSIANRRKQLAQAVWLRARISDHLARGDSLILMGDLNDGPGLDEYENLFGRSSVEILLGDDMYDPHARQALQRKLGASPTTARFNLPGSERYLQALLDYVMISQNLMAKRPAWRIWHPFDDARCYRDPNLRDALLTASDHFPVTLDIDI